MINSSTMCFAAVVSFSICSVVLGGQLNDITILSSDQHGHQPTHIAFNFEGRTTYALNQNKLRTHGRMTLIFNQAFCIDEKRRIAFEKTMSELSFVKKAHLRQARKNKKNLKLTVHFHENKDGSSLTGGIIKIGRKDNSLLLTVFPHGLTHELAKTKPIVHLALGPPCRPRILIDAGFKGPDAGAKGLFSLANTNISHAFASRLKPLLEKWGARAILTSSGSVRPTRRARLTLAQQFQADLVVSINTSCIELKQAECQPTLLCRNIDKHICKQIQMCGTPHLPVAFSTQSYDCAQSCMVEVGLLNSTQLAYNNTLIDHIARGVSNGIKSIF